MLLRLPFYDLYFGDIILHPLALSPIIVLAEVKFAHDLNLAS